MKLTIVRETLPANPNRTFISKPLPAGKRIVAHVRLEGDFEPDTDVETILRENN